MSRGSSVISRVVYFGQFRWFNFNLLYTLFKYDIGTIVVYSTVPYLSVTVLFYSKVCFYCYFGAFPRGLPP